MKVIMVGGGRTGFGLAKRLLSTDHEPVIIEKDKDRAAELSKNLDALIITGSGTNIQILKKAGVNKSDAISILTPNDETNLMITKLAKTLGCERVIARVNESKHVEMFEDVGADVAISTIESTIGLFEKAITGPEFYGLLSLGGDKAEVIEVTVSKNSKAVGRAIKDLEMPDLCRIAMITRNEKLIPTNEETVIMEDDKVILVGDKKEITSIGKLLRGKMKDLKIPP